MKEKKHIDALFKEAFKEFEATPPANAWENIQAGLKKEKEERKIIPIWWKLGGVAALLALLLTAGKFVFPTPDTSQPAVVEINKTTDTIQNGSEEMQLNSPNKAEIASEEVVEEASKNDMPDPKINSVANSSQKENSNTPQKSIQKEETGIATTVISNSKKKDEINNAETTNPLFKDNVTDPASKTVDAIADQKHASQEENSTETSVENTNVKESIVENSTKDIQVKKDGVRKETGISDQVIKTETGIAQLEKTEKDNSVVNKTKKEDANKTSIYDAIAEAKEIEKEDIQQKGANARSWEVTPNVAPVFYGSLTEGSSLDTSFADNAQSGDVNVSYGVQVSYELSDRLKIRSGISNVNLGYSTGGIDLATGPVGVALRSIDYGDRNVVLSAFDRGELSNLPMPSADDPFGEITPKSTGGNAQINQNISYYEVPMELSYTLLDSKFGIHMIGGFSTLFLGDNEVSVQDGNFRSSLGEANNLNSVSFSTNVGLGFGYKFSKRLRFNVEPMFKYQLNPYSDSSVSYRPYYLGVYSGLSFKF